MTLVVLFAALLALVLLGVPVILALGLVGLAGFLSIDTLPPALFAQRAFATLDSFSLLALPYFIFAGALMARGGLAARIVGFSQLLVGHVRGSLGHTTVVTCTLMAYVSGSSVAKAGAVGLIVIPEMKGRCCVNRPRS